jgi:uncharacterized protein (TIGR03067 family)
MNARRRGREKQVKEIPATAAPGADPWRNLESLLDRELNHLPEKYRLPIILCDLEGECIREAARQLGCPQGTLAGRLSRGRTMLAKRLTRRGIVLSGGSLAALLSRNTASGAMPHSLVASTVKIGCLVTAGRTTGEVLSPKVAALMKGVMKVMLLTRLKSLTTAMCLLALFGVAMGALAYTAMASGQSEAPVAVKRKDNSPPVEDMGNVRITAQGNRLLIDATVKGGRTRVHAAAATYQKEKGEGTLILQGNTDNPLVVERDGQSSTLRGFCIKLTSGAIAVVPDGTVGVEPKPAVAAALPPPVETDEQRIEGAWTIVDVESQGLRLSEAGDARSKEILRKCNMVFWKGEIEGIEGLFASLSVERKVQDLGHGRLSEEARLILQAQEEPRPNNGDIVPYKLNPSTQPKRIDVTLPNSQPGQRLKGIYSFQNDALVIAFGDEKVRPDDFRAAKDSRNIVLTLRRPIPEKAVRPTMVGRIIIVGNEKTPAEMILKRLKLQPGKIFDDSSLRRAEKNLEGLDRFVVDPKKGMRPSVRVVDRESGSPYKDILVTVQERNAD